MQDQYRREMERLLPRREALERLYEMTEGGTEMKQVRRWSFRAAVVVLACAALTVTAAAAAAPAVWEALTGHLGRFVPYAQTIQGASCTDQGIEVQVISALADDLESRVYLSVRDVEGDRLNEHLTLEGRLTIGEQRLPESGGEEGISIASVNSTRSFTLLSYDPETRTALFSASVSCGELLEENGLTEQDKARLTLTGMSSRPGEFCGSIPGTAIPGGTLASLPAEKDSTVLLTPGDVANLGYTDAVLPRERVVLAPEQNPMALPDTEDIWVSSLGFAADGCLHLRLGLAEGVVPVSKCFYGDIYLPEGDFDSRWYTVQVLLLDHGVDILFPLIKTEDLPLLAGGEVRLSGDYTRPGAALEGSWSVSFQLEHYTSRTLGWTGELAGRQVDQVTVSPLSVTMRSNDKGGFHSAVLAAVLEDGTAVSARPGAGCYANVGPAGGEPVWDTFNTWRFEEPVDPADIVSLTLLGETIPVD